MMELKLFLLASIFRDPESCKSLKINQWDLLIRQARVTGTLGRLQWLLEDKSLLLFVPDAPLAHLTSFHVLVSNQKRAINWEIECLHKAFNELGLPLVLLKGAAYLLCDNSAAKGRLFSDVDILVQKDELLRVEKILKFHGWVSGHIEEYDDKYYRTWMHEIPPLQHINRGTTLDVHHTILPLTSKMKPDPKKLFLNKQKVNPDSDQEVYTLSPIDMIIHSSTHLFHEGEFDKGFRDLGDLDAMIRQYSQSQENFWTELVDRARELDLELPLFYGLRYSHYFLETPLGDSETTLKNIKPKSIMLMDFMFKAAFLPDHSSCNLWYTSFVRWCLYIRSHHLRMPAYLLIPHLLRKAYMTWINDRKEQQDK